MALPTQPLQYHQQVLAAAWVDHVVTGWCQPLMLKRLCEIFSQKTQLVYRYILIFNQQENNLEEIFIRYVICRGQKFYKLKPSTFAICAKLRVLGSS